MIVHLRPLVAAARIDERTRSRTELRPRKRTHRTCAADVREATAAGLGFLGVALDDGHAQTGPDAEISAEGARVRTLVIRAREDLEIASQVRRLLGAG